jgi:hypothetical protein
MKSNGMMWWRLPENREWYRYISIWLYSSWLLIAVWSLCVYSAWYLMYAGSIENRVEGWAHLYRIWAITCLAGIFFLSISFLVIGFQKYKRLKLNIIFPTWILLSAFPLLASSLWFAAVLFFKRQIYEPNLSLALFDGSWMVGLVTASFSTVHCVINWIARSSLNSRNSADV